MKNTPRPNAGSAADPSMDTQTSALPIPSNTESRPKDTLRQDRPPGLRKIGRPKKGTPSRPLAKEFKDITDEWRANSRDLVGTMCSVCVDPEARQFVTLLSVDSGRPARAIIRYIVDRAIETKAVERYYPFQTEAQAHISWRSTSHWIDKLDLVAKTALPYAATRSVLVNTCLLYAMQERSYCNWVRFFEEGSDIIERIEAYLAKKMAKRY